MKVSLAAAAGFVAGVFAMYTLQNALTVGEASKNKRSVAEARTIADALERYRAANGNYPPLEGGSSGLATHLVPRFARSIWQKDIYDRPFIITVDRTGVAVASLGRNGFAVRGQNRSEREQGGGNGVAAAPQPGERLGHQAAGPLRIGGEVSAPTVVRRVEPDVSKCKGTYAGNPAVEAVVRRDGSITDIKLIRSVDPCVDTAFLSAVRRWQFRPGTLNGKPVDVRYAVTAHLNYR